MKLPGWTSLRWRVVAIFTLLFSLVFAVGYYGFYVSAHALALRYLQTELLDTLRGVARGVDGDKLRQLAAEVSCPGDDPAGCYPADPRYWELVAWLDQAHQIETRAEPYTYIRGDQPGELIFLTSAGAVRQPPFGAKFREHDLAQDPTLNYRGLLTTTFEALHTDQFGRWLSGYTPLYDSSGQVVAGLGVDFSASYLDELTADLRAAALWVFAGSYCFLLALVHWFSGRLIRPVTRLAQMARRLSEVYGTPPSSPPPPPPN